MGLNDLQEKQSSNSGAAKKASMFKGDLASQTSSMEENLHNSQAKQASDSVATQKASKFKGDLASGGRNRIEKTEFIPISVDQTAKSCNNANSAEYMSFNPVKKGIWICPECKTRNNSRNGCAVCGFNSVAKIDRLIEEYAREQKGRNQKGNSNEGGGRKPGNKPEFQRRWLLLLLIPVLIAAGLLLGRKTAKPQGEIAIQGNTTSLSEKTDGKDVGVTKAPETPDTKPEKSPEPVDTEPEKSPEPTDTEPEEAPESTDTEPEPAAKPIEPFCYSYRSGDELSIDVDGDGTSDTVKVKDVFSPSGLPTPPYEIDIETSSSGNIHFSTEDAFTPTGDLMGADLGDGSTTLVLTIQATMTAPHIHAYTYKVVNGAFKQVDVDYEQTLFTGYTDGRGEVLTVEPIYGSTVKGGTGATSSDRQLYSSQNMDSYLHNVEVAYNSSAQRYEIVTKTVLYVSFHNNPLAYGYTRYALANGKLTITEQWVEFNYDIPEQKSAEVSAAPTREADNWVHFYPMGEACKYDMNGDGIAEEILVERVSTGGLNNEGYVIINGVSYPDDYWYPVDEYCIMTFDKEAGMLLLAISDYGPSDNYRFTEFYRYDNGSFKSIGSINDTLLHFGGGGDTDGAGYLYANEDMFVITNWTGHSKYRLFNDSMLTTSGNTSRSVGKPKATVLTDLVVYEKPNKNSDMFILSAGTEVELYSVYYENVDVAMDDLWVSFFDTKKGITCWAKMEDGDIETVYGYRWAESLFDGFAPLAG